MSKKNLVIRYVVLAILLVVAVVLIWSLLGQTNKIKELSYEGTTSLTSMLENQELSAVYVDGSYKVYVLKAGKTQEEINKFFANPAQKADYYVNVPSRTVVADKINNMSGINLPTIKYSDPSANVSWSSYIFPIGALIIMGIVLFIIFKQGAGANKQAMSFGKVKARLNKNVSVRFTDVAGAEEEKVELQEIVEFLKDPKKFTSLGAKVPRGVLLVGPPGTGKTLFAKAVAGESNVPFFSISGSDFVEMFVGTGAARVRDLFDQAKKNAPCIVFIDEIDAVGRQRGAGLGGGNDEREQTLNQLLVQMDGFEKNTEIIVMAATNRADVLDPALLRPGRFDRQIYVNMPDVKGREAILKVHARNKPLAPDVSFKILARMTTGFSGADLENLLNEAAILAARADRKLIVMEDVLEAINKVIAGPQKKSRVVTDVDKRITAYHEAGHAIVARVLPNCDQVQEVSIIPRGMAAGYTLTRPETDDSHVTKNKLLDNISMMLGGRAAEEIVIKDISTGASNDIERATSIARRMVTEWGMTDSLGNMFLGGEKEVFLGKDYGAAHNYSENVAATIDKEIKTFLSDAYKKAKDILIKNRDILDNMVKVLFEKETIYTEDVDMLFDYKSAEEVIAAIEEREKKTAAYKKEKEQSQINEKIEIVEETVKEEEKVEKEEKDEKPQDEQ